MKLNNYDITHTSYTKINENRDPIKEELLEISYTLMTY